MLVIVRQKAIGASMSVSTPPLDRGLQRSMGKRMIWRLQCGLLFAPAKRTGLDRFEATQRWSEAESQLATSPTALNKAWAPIRSAALWMDGIVEIGIGALSHVLCSRNASLA